MLRYKKGQSTLEYVILVTAVIVIVIGLVAGNNSLFRTTMNQTLNGAVGGIDVMSNRWQCSIY